jgi:tRNA(Arg) A34 adenosine deaminase TadA
MQQPHHIRFDLPEWLSGFIRDTEAIQDVHKRMDFVIAAARRNIAQKTGGPFAAAVFEVESGKLVSLGVNLVTTQGSSILHAEIVAIAVAQKKLGAYNLRKAGIEKYELVASAEPCAMCFGAIPWSGICRVVTAATSADVRSIGFDEGTKVDHWQSALLAKQIDVRTEVNRDEARVVLNEYTQQGGTIYNGGMG